MIKNCVVCDCKFDSKEPEQIKCSLCEKLYPNAKNLAEATKQSSPQAAQLEINVTEKRVREVVYGILEEAGIKRQVCGKCEKLFFKTSPAQKYCSNCKEN